MNKCLGLSHVWELQLQWEGGDVKMLMGINADTVAAPDSE